MKAAANGMAAVSYSISRLARSTPRHAGTGLPSSRGTGLTERTSLRLTSSICCHLDAPWLRLWWLRDHDLKHAVFFPAARTSVESMVSGKRETAMESSVGTLNAHTLHVLFGNIFFPLTRDRQDSLYSNQLQRQNQPVISEEGSADSLMRVLRPPRLDSSQRIVEE